MKKIYLVKKYYHNNKKIRKYQGLLLLCVGLIPWVGLVYATTALINNQESISQSIFEEEYSEAEIIDICFDQCRGDFGFTASVSTEQIGEQLWQCDCSSKGGGGWLGEYGDGERYPHIIEPINANSECESYCDNSRCVEKWAIANNYEKYFSYESKYVSSLQSYACECRDYETNAIIDRTPFPIQRVSNSLCPIN